MAIFFIGLFELLLGSIFTELIAVLASTSLDAFGLTEAVTGLASFGG